MMTLFNPFPSSLPFPGSSRSDSKSAPLANVRTPRYFCCVGRVRCLHDFVLYVDRAAPLGQTDRRVKDEEARSFDAAVLLWETRE